MLAQAFSVSISILAHAFSVSISILANFYNKKSVLLDRKFHFFLFWQEIDFVFSDFCDHICCFILYKRSIFGRKKVWKKNNFGKRKSLERFWKNKKETVWNSFGRAYIKATSHIKVTQKQSTKN